MEIIIGVLVLSVILNILLGIAARNSLKKIENFENKIITTNVMLNNMLEAMREIDERGMFEKDDEVGSVFEQLKTLIEFYSKLIKSD